MVDAYVLLFQLIYRIDQIIIILNLTVKITFLKKKHFVIKVCRPYMVIKAKQYIFDRFQNSFEIIIPSFSCCWHYIILVLIAYFADITKT